jgi:hypothetical protein
MERSAVVRAAVGAQAISLAGIGAWAMLAPRSFYDDFPGGGRAWVAADGPYNEHLVRDFGDLNMALAVVSAIAAVTLVRAVVVAAAAAALVYSVPHIAYHLANLDVYDTGDKVGNVVALSLAIVLPVVVLVAELGGRRRVDPDRADVTGPGAPSRAAAAEEPQPR